MFLVAEQVAGAYQCKSRNNNYIMQINLLKQQLVLSDLDVVKPITLSVSKDALKVLKQTMTENKK